ncbi:MAG: NAD(P)/FAD-dependent oxidoreductase [Acidimicrobiales bacterium]|nr:MAG: NAD(P)/FAD-dependent oxidoreductase [Acidimicrobiales bacterium]
MITPDYDILIIGAGAAGMMCGAVAGARGKSVLILDHAKAAGEKIRISGGGRCNFTNIHSTHKNFLSQNPHFCKSALASYTPQDFIDLVESHGISWHEKTKGQLFCDGRSGQIIQMLLDECAKAGNKIQLQTEISNIEHRDGLFHVATSKGAVSTRSLVVACGGPSIPKMGATGFGYKVAEQFGLKIVEPRAGLVPLTFTDDLKTPLKSLSGVSTDVIVRHDKTRFDEALLITHRGLSGPAILQISSYWQPGDEIEINLAPAHNIAEALTRARQDRPKLSPVGFLKTFLPDRLAEYIAQGVNYERLADMNNKALSSLAAAVNQWIVKPAGTEGYRTAEVALGGVDTNELSSKTMQAKSVPGLYFIGEVVDVTGHLGGHNFQWAWASAVAAGKVV